MLWPNDGWVESSNGSTSEWLFVGFLHPTGSSKGTDERKGGCGEPTILVSARGHLTIENQGTQDSGFSLH